MKTPPSRRASAATYILSSLLLLSCLTLPIQAQDLTLGDNIGTSVGSHSYLSGTYTIMGNGTGIEFSGSNGHDQMRFVHSHWTGDVEIVAHVASFDNTGEGNVGLAIRSGIGTGDQMGTCVFIPYHNYYHAPGLVNWSRGPALDGNADYYDKQGKGDGARAGLAPPFWMKLVKIGSNYSGYWSRDGRDWYLVSNTSGGAFFPTGTYEVGIFVASGSSDTSVISTAVIDYAKVSAPSPKYKTSWVGSTSAGVAAGHPSNQVYSMWVKPDGTCYTESNWDESGQPGKLYKDGKVLHAFYFTNGGGLEGGVTGNATNIFYYDNHGNTIYRSDFATNSPTPVTFSTPVGEVRGLAASATRLFVSDYEHGTVRIVDLTQPTPTEISSFSLPRCGPIAFDGTNFWVIQGATHDTYAFSWHVVGTDPTSIICYNSSGSPTGQTITWPLDTCIPTALAYQHIGSGNTTTAADVLWVCDNSPHQNIRRYTNLTGTPTATTAFGVDRGLWNGSGHAGQITDTTSGAGGDQRFYGPTGVGTDSNGNIYVACNGASHFVSDIRKFNSGGTLQWRINGLVFVHEGDFDPANDGQDIYLPEKHLRMNYANTAAGSEWSYQGFTRDLTKNLSEPRNGGALLGINVCGTKLARVGTNPPGTPTPPDNLYMYTSGQGNVGETWFYRFNGETAVPFGRYRTGGPNYTDLLWIDANNNQQVDHTPGADEETSAPVAFTGGLFQSFDVDSLGDIWMVFKTQPSNIRCLIAQGTQTIGTSPNTAIVPKYNFTNPGGYVDYKAPAPLEAVWNISFDAPNHVLYAIGQTSDGTWKLVRCNNWDTNPENQLNPVATWAVNIIAPPDLSILLPPTDLAIKSFQYMGMDLATDKIFIAELFGPVHAYDAATGNLELTLNPGPELSGTMGWVDMSMGVNACKRSTGEYLILQDQTGFNACDILYRWTPTADTAVTSAPLALTATPAGRKIVLSWNGPTGMVTSYKLYRGIVSGSETLYQSGITSPTFTDLNVTPSQTYYYKVVAVNAAGDSAQSNEASAAAMSGAAEFVKTDSTTQGTWKGVYGADGYEICNYATSFPPYAQPTAGNVTWSTYPIPATPALAFTFDTLADPSTDVRALQKPDSSSERIAADRSSGGTAWPFSWNITMGDGKWHQVAVYIVDWNNSRPTGISVQVIDTTTGNILDTRSLGNHQNGKYLVWNVIGNVQVKVVQNPMTAATIASGFFFDPVKVPTPGIAWWKLDDTGSSLQATDSSGAGHNGTRAGTAVWNASGKINGCVSIPGGTTARVNLPNGMIANHPPLSVTAWFKTSSTSGAVIMGCTNGTSPSEWDPVLYVGADGKLRGTYYTNPGPTAYTRVMSSTTTANNGQWHHTALVADGGTQALYLDGVLVDYKAATFSTTALNYNYLGYCNTSLWPSVSAPTNTFNGYLDDVRIYDKALTPGQVYTLGNP